jgi:hypothetical protein
MSRGLAGPLLKSLTGKRFIAFLIRDIRAFYFGQHFHLNRGLSLNSSEKPVLNPYFTGGFWTI